MLWFCCQNCQFHPTFPSFPLQYLALCFVPEISTAKHFRHFRGNGLSTCCPSNPYLLHSKRAHVQAPRNWIDCKYWAIKLKANTPLFLNAAIVHYGMQRAMHWCLIRALVKILSRSHMTKKKPRESAMDFEFSHLYSLLQNLLTILSCTITLWYLSFSDQRLWLKMSKWLTEIHIMSFSYSCNFCEFYWYKCQSCHKLLPVYGRATILSILCELALL